ncbi:MAG: hypothetical protein GY757_55470 [bacterium]|nr:hypothetical protein [bacterium]
MAYKKYFPVILVVICFMSLVLAGCEGGTVPEGDNSFKCPIPGEQVMGYETMKSAFGPINFNPPGFCGVKFVDTHLAGYAWGETIGWIKFGADSDKCDKIDEPDGSNGSEEPYYDRVQNVATTCWGVNRGAKNSDGYSSLTGFAWGPSVGWINFGEESNTGGGHSTEIEVTMDYQGYLEGNAWGESVGWIRFYSKDNPEPEPKNN